MKYFVIISNLLLLYSIVCIENVICEEVNRNKRKVHGDPPGSKAKTKCEEYAQYVYTLEDSPVLSRRSMKKEVSQCGIVEVPLIIGGIEAKPKEFPHLAVIGFEMPPIQELRWLCGGSLVSEKMILTAAHCLHDQTLLPKKVRLGEVDFTKEDESNMQEKDIESYILHPEHKSSKYNDIAIIKMDSPATFDAYVRPACLNIDPTVRESSVIAAGFGKTDFMNAHGSDHLMKVNLKEIKKDQCETYFKQDIDSGNLNHGIIESMICAGELKGGKDTCQGDSGGPLQVVLAEPYCMYSIVGIVSFGKYCGFAHQPAIYTRVSSFIPWLEEHLWP